MSDDLKKLIGSEVGQYTITKYISSGSFGDVFEAKDREGQYVALKIPIENDERNGLKLLLEEVKVYNQLNKENESTDRSSAPIGISNIKVIKYNNKKVLVMDLLGTSLETLLQKSKAKRFRLKTIILMAIQLLDIMKFIHSKGYIHRDIKPDNFVIGTGENSNKLYCIDFGIAKKFMRGDKHISFKSDLKFCGTARYASISAHKGHEQSRKDDLESIGYLLIYLYKGTLPWMGIKNKDKKERYRRICEKKEKISEEDLCDKLPKEFMIFLKYVRNLDFDEKPHYTALKKMFMKLYDSKEYGDNDFDFL
jgi:serine/threonine protein kinase